MNTAMTYSTTASVASLNKYSPTYYVNSQTLSKHVSRHVRLVGRVVQVFTDGTRAQIEACDGGMITIQRSSGGEMYGSKFVCITGIVQHDLSIQEEFFDFFGDSFSNNE